MATKINARPKNLEAVDRKVSGTRPRPQAQPEPQLVTSERPTIPSAAPVEAGVDFEAHDTIPAPPWLGDDSA